MVKENSTSRAAGEFRANKRLPSSETAIEWVCGLSKLANSWHGVGDEAIANPARTFVTRCSLMPYGRCYHAFTGLARNAGGLPDMACR